jgi:predicted O-methyltransferase YrrM
MLGQLKNVVRTLFLTVRGPADSATLAVLDPSQIAAIFRSPHIDRQWNTIAPRLEDLCQIEDLKTGGVNPGDRRALFYVVKALRPTSVLEIGSHVGASTAHISAAMAAGSRLVTVDTHDVNDGPDAYWRTFGLQRSPRQMLGELNNDLDVRFVKSDSITFLKKTELRFDLVFLDGDHSKGTVIQEVPKSLGVLNENGVILLHDYFPDGKPLWSDGSVIPGPFDALEELQMQDARLRVVPFGALPWATKLGSHITSLAMVIQKQ